MSNCECEFELHTAEERRTLWIVLVINATMFVIEGTAGLWANSSGLLADSLDMASDAALYGVALYAIGRPDYWKSRATTLFGWSLLLLAASVIIDVLRRFIYGNEPESQIMLLMSILALAANITCLKLLARFRKDKIHLRAAYICSQNDVLANIGVFISGALVMLMNSRWPDLLIGIAIAILIMRSCLEILREAAEAQSHLLSPTNSCNKSEGTHHD